MDQAPRSAGVGARHGFTSRCRDTAAGDTVLQPKRRTERSNDQRPRKTASCLGSWILSSKTLKLTSRDLKAIYLKSGRTPGRRICPPTINPPAWPILGSSETRQGTPASAPKMLRRTAVAAASAALVLACVSYQWTGGEFGVQQPYKNHRLAITPAGAGSDQGTELAMKLGGLAAAEQLAGRMARGGQAVVADDALDEGWMTKVRHIHCPNSDRRCPVSRRPCAA